MLVPKFVAWWTQSSYSPKHFLPHIQEESAFESENLDLSEKQDGRQLGDSRINWLEPLIGEALPGDHSGWRDRVGQLSPQKFPASETCRMEMK